MKLENTAKEILFELRSRAQLKKDFSSKVEPIIAKMKKVLTDKEMEIIANWYAESGIQSDREGNSPY